MSKIDDAIEECIDEAVKGLDWQEIIESSVDFKEMVEESVDFGDLARDALIDNVSDVLADALPEALREADIVQAINQKFTVEELIRSGVDFEGMAQNAIEKAQEDRYNELVGEITMLKLEIAKLKDAAKPQTWLRKVAAVFGL